MAKNKKYSYGDYTLPVVKATAENARASNIALSGDPVVVGQIPGVALNNADANGKCAVGIDGIWEFLVGGIDQSGNSAVLGGDKIYFTAANAPPLNKKNTGIPFGYAVGDAGTTLVASANITTKINVKVGG